MDSVEIESAQRKPSGRGPRPRRLLFILGGGTFVVVWCLVVADSIRDGPESPTHAVPRGQGDPARLGMLQVGWSPGGAAILVRSASDVAGARSDGADATQSGSTQCRVIRVRRVGSAPVTGLWLVLLSGKFAPDGEWIGNVWNLQGEVLHVSKYFDDSPRISGETWGALWRGTTSQELDVRRLMPGLGADWSSEARRSILRGSPTQSR